MKLLLTLCATPALAAAVVAHSATGHSSAPVTPYASLPEPVQTAPIQRQMIQRLLITTAPAGLETRALLADSIVHGVIGGIDLTLHDGIVHAEVQVLVETVFKGGPQETVTLLVPGGTIGNRTVECSQAPVFASGDEAVLFLTEEVREGVRGVLGLADGVAVITRDSGWPMVAEGPGEGHELEVLQNLIWNALAR